MTAPLYFAAEMDALTPSDNSVVEDTSGGTFNATYARCSIKVPGGGSFCAPVSFSPQTTAWFHFEMTFDAFNSGFVDTFVVYDNANAPMFKMQTSQYTPTLFNYTYRIFYWSGSSFTQIGSDVVTASALQTIDLFFSKDQGRASMYVADSLQTTGTATMSSVTNMASVKHFGGRDGHNNHWSQMVGSTVSTVGTRLQTIVVDTNGAAQDFTGAVTDINEIPYNDATGITSGTNGNVSTYYKNGLTISGNILGLGVSARFNVGTTGPQSLQLVVRVGSTNYTSPSNLGATGFGPAQYFWDQDPSLGAPWGNTAAQNAQEGVKAIT